MPHIHRPARLLALVVLLALAFTTPALAHHALGGRMPAGLLEGLISGLAHPVIEIDHFAFVVTVGVLTAVAQAGLWPPVWFVGGTVIGCLLTSSGVYATPGTWMVPISALVLGGFMASGRGENGRFMRPAFLVAGVLHGLAYAQEIIGSENTSIQGYLLGFGITQILVAWGAMMAAYWLWRGDRLYTNARVLGGVLAGGGLTGLYQAGLSVLLPVA